MQKITLEFKQLDLQETVKQNKEIYKTETATHIVASTKSYNNLIKDYQAQNKVPTHTERKDIFLDKAKVEEAIFNVIDEQIENDEDKESVFEFVRNALEGICIYYNPIIRKKSND